MKKIETKYIVAIIISLILGASLVGYGYLDYSYKKEALKQRQEQESKALIQKQEQEKKEYLSKRSNECYTIYEKERKQFNNVEGHFYDEINDKCVVRYTTKEYEGVDCQKEYGSVPSWELECKLGIFTKKF